MLKLFRNPSPFSIVFLFLFTIGIRFWSLTHPQLPVVENNLIIWNAVLQVLHSVFGNSAFAFTFFAVVNLIAQAFFINHIADRHRLFHHASFLPGMSYVLASSIISDFNFLSAPLIASWLLLIAFNLILDTYGKAEVRKQIFNIGFCLSLASLFYPPYFILIVAAFISLAIMRPLKLLEYVIYFLGILTPLYFLAAVLFLFDRFYLMKLLPMVQWSYPIVFKNLSVVILAVLVLLIWGAFSVFYLNIYLQKMLSQIKKMWGVVIIFAIFAAISSVVSYGKEIAGWMGFIALSSPIFANPFFESRRKWIADLLFYFIILAVIWLQWFPDTINFF